MQNTIIETSSLTKRFSTSESYRALFRLKRREELTAVNAVTLQVREGELFGLLGPNGAGKTTLIKMLCTLILPTEGRATVCGRDVAAEAAAVRQSIGLVDCQERSFFWRLSGRQNLEFFAALHGLRGAEADARIDQVLSLMGLEDHADRRFMGYSSGMRQKVAVARGLLTMPCVVFMDEATRGLDPLIARELRAFVRETLVEKLRRTVVWVTHHLEEAEELCDRVAIMNQGRIIACGPTSEVKKRIPPTQRCNLRVEGLMPQALDALRAIPGVLRLEHTTGGSDDVDLRLAISDEQEPLHAVISSIVSYGGKIKHCNVQSLSLEEAFVRLVREDGV